MGRKEKNVMKIIIYGAGGVGGYFGGRLVQAGANVTFIARGEHLKALRTSGLKVDSISGDFHLPEVQATDNAAEIGEVDVVISCVKMAQLAETTEKLRPLLKPSTLVVPLQNGVDAPRIISEILGREHAGVGLCRVVSFIAGPGHIRHVAAEPTIVFGEIDNRSTERIYELQKLLNRAQGVTAEIPPDIQAALWRKFVLIVAGSSMGSITRAPIDLVRERPETRAMLIQLMRETIAVGQAHHVKLSADDIDRALAFVDGLPPNSTTSMQRDIIERRPSELEYKCGAVVRLGREVSVPTPLNAFIYHSLLLQEQRARGEVGF